VSAVVIQLLEDRLTEGEQRIVSIEKSHWKGLLDFVRTPVILMPRLQRSEEKRTQAGRLTF